MTHFHCRQQTSIGQTDVGIVPINHMEQHTIVTLVRRMVVPIPIRGMKMHLNATGPQTAIDAQPYICEIRTGIRIEHTRTQHLYRLSVNRDKRCVKKTMLPEVLQKSLGHGNYELRVEN